MVFRSPEIVVPWILAISSFDSLDAAASIANALITPPLDAGSIHRRATPSQILSPLISPRPSDPERSSLPGHTGVGLELTAYHGRNSLYRVVSFAAPFLPPPPRVEGFEV